MFIRMYLWIYFIVNMLYCLWDMYLYLYLCKGVCIRCECNVCLYRTISVCVPVLFSSSFTFTSLFYESKYECIYGYMLCLCIEWILLFVYLVFSFYYFFSCCCSRHAPEPVVLTPLAIYCISNSLFRCLYL